MLRTIVIVLAAWFLSGSLLLAPGMLEASGATTLQRNRGAQGLSGPSANVQLASGVVKLGESVRVVVRVEYAQEARITKVPEAEGLGAGKVGAPQEGRFRSIVNGRQTILRSKTWVIHFAAIQEGEFTIPPVELLVDGQALQSQELAAIVVADLRGGDLGFFDFKTSALRAYEGQVVEFEMHFGWDLSIEDRLSDYNLNLPWWENLPGWVELDSGPPTLGRQRTPVRLNRNSQVEADVAPMRKQGKRTFRELVIKRRYLPTRPGKMSLPRSFLSFTQVLERSNSFFGRDKTETFYVPAEALEIEVLPLPEEGQPFDFRGAVGNFVSSSEVDRRDVDAGDSVKLNVEWFGEGNFEFFEVPDLERDERFKQFRVYGKTETKAADRRSVIYDLAPLNGDVTEVPGVRLPVFDLATEKYAVVETASIPIRVRALSDAGGLDEEVVETTARDIQDIETHIDPASSLPEIGSKPLLGGLSALPVLWLLTRRVNRRRGDPNAPQARRRRQAKRQLGRDLSQAQQADARLRVWHEFLGARTGRSAEAWLGRDPLQEAPLALGEGELPLELRSAWSELNRRLERSVFDSTSAAEVSDEEVLAVADRLLEAGL